MLSRTVMSFLLWLDSFLTKSVRVGYKYSTQKRTVYEEQQQSELAKVFQTKTVSPL